MRVDRVRPAAARLLTFLAVLAAVASGALFWSRYVPARVLPLRPDTWAMATAFTDLAAPGLVLATVAAAVALALRRRVARAVLVGLCAAATAVPLLLLAPRWVPDADVPGSRSLTALALNARLGQAEPEALAAAARTVDLVVLTEATAPLLRSLADAGVTERLPYRSTGSLPTAGAAGTVVLSRFPVTRTEPLSSHLSNQAWVCVVDLPGSGPALTVVAVHPARPRTGGTRWLAEQEDLRAALPTSGPRLLAGDFNAVSSHPTQRALVADGWRSAVDEAGAGWVPTYPADGRFVPPLIDIDHVLVTGGVRATAARSVAVPGTDHLGLLVDVTLTPDP